MSDGWWNDSESEGNVGDYDPAQIAATQSQLDPNTTYAPPGTAAPIDQYNFVPDPNAPGGYQTYGPGQVAPVDLAAFSNQSGQYPDLANMANSLANSQTPQTPTIDLMGNATWLDQYNQMEQQAQDTWNAQYGPDAAPFAWGQQTGNYAMPPGAEGFNNLPPDQQNTWYGTYGGNAPAIWAAQSQQAAQGQQVPGVPPGQWSGGAYGVGDFSYGASMGPYPSWMGGGGTPWNNSASIGAGTSEIPYGWGVPGFGQSPIPIRPEYLAQFGNQQWMQQNMPGYIPGSGTYNQYNLSDDWLLGQINGQVYNNQWGSGGAGDPTTGAASEQAGAIQTKWRNAGQQLFQLTGPNLENEYSILGNAIGRAESPSGLSTAAIPQVVGPLLVKAIREGRLKPTAAGQQFMQEYFGVTPQQYGGPPIAGGGPGGAGGQGPMGAGTQAFNYQAAYLDYLTARMNMLDIPGMQNQNQWQVDRLAFDQAKQKWLEQYQQQTFGEGQRQFNELQGLRQGELTGSYNGQATLGQQTLNNQTALGYLGLLGNLRGPGDIFQYLKVLQGTPGGIRDIVNAASGAYRMPGTGGSNITVGGANTGGGANLDSLLGQINDPNYGAEGQNLNLPLPNQINALALQRMAPSQQQALLAAYEAAGYNPQDVMAIFRNSLPQYAGTQGSAGRVGLFRR